MVGYAIHHPNEQIPTHQDKHVWGTILHAYYDRYNRIPFKKYEGDGEHRVPVLQDIQFHDYEL